MELIEAIKTCLARSFQFTGRASRAEYWKRFGLSLLVTCIGAGVALVSITIIGALCKSSGLADFGFFAGFLILFPVYASIIWTFWIGFVRGEPHTNRYDPPPSRVSP